VSIGSVPVDLRWPGESARTARVRIVRDPVIVTVAALTVLALVLRFWRIGHQGFWFDEANTAADIRFSPGSMLGLLSQNETTPPLFYCVAWVWARVFGFSEPALRALPALSGVAAVPLMYASATRLVTRRAGLVAAALTACNPFLVWYSQEFRPYEPLVALSAAGLLCFACARERPTARAVAAWGVVSALAIGVHYYALLVVVPEAACLLVAHRRHRGVLIAVGVVGLVGVALLPLAISQNATGNASWIGGMPLLPRLGQIVPQSLIGFQAPAHTLLLLIAETAAVLALALAALRGDGRERSGALIAVGLVIAGLALNAVLLVGGIDDLITRNLLALWPPAAIVLAAGLGARRAGRLGIAAAGLLCVTGVVAVAGVAVNRGFQRPDWRAVAHQLGSLPAPVVGDRVILVQRYRDLLPLKLYLPHLKFLPNAGAQISELDVVSIKAPRVPLCWWGAACNLSGSRMQARYRIPGFHALWRRRALQFTVLRLVANRPVLVTPEMVGAALTTTRLSKDDLLVQPR
jgi:mannosyltransferase